MIYRSENCITAVEDLNGLVESRKDAYERSHSLHWTSRPKTAATSVPAARERIATAPASIAGDSANEVKALKVFEFLNAFLQLNP